MNIEKQYQDDHSVKLIVEFDAEKTNAYKRRAAARISSRSKIPGFRPGKAPYEIVVRNFGEGAIAEQAIDLLIDDEYSKILTEAEVNPGAAGALESVDNLDPFKMTFHVPLAPEVDLGDYHAVRLPYEWQAPGEKEVEEALENLRQMYSTTETVEREIQTGDYVLLDVESETTELNRKGFATFVRNEDRDGEWPYSGFAKELIGLKSGESKTITHAFPEDWDVEELKGKSADIKVTIKTVRGVTLPDLDDELAKMTGAGDTLDALREAVKKDVEARSKDEYDDKYFADLIEKIKEGATIKYHARTLEHESEHVLSDLSSRLAQQNMDLEAYFKARNTTREKFIEEEVNPVAKKRLERSLILDEIIRREKIQADNASLESEYNNTMFSLMQQGIDLSKARGGRQGQRQISQAIAMESISRVVTRKALDTLKAIATGEYKPAEETPESQAAAEEPKEESQSESSDQQEKTAE
ncbi:MAG: trigger factor [Chloroflexi bacterium]|nr:trigger factor [Chloroflexota bacterium]MCA2002639.1 trigger factor [Chloroflexota bacterium]